jgi:hypothetical protein
MPYTQRDVENEIRAGVPNEAPRRSEYVANALYADGEFDADIQVWMSAIDGPRFPRESIRTSRIMARVLDVLTANLYRIGPDRSVQDDDAATEWLTTLYQERAVDALFQTADRLALANHVSAFEVYADDDAESPSPVGLRLWGGEELYVWTDPNDSRRPWAVATLDVMDTQRRIRLWTAEQRVEFVTDKLQDGQTAGGTYFREIGRDANPWGFLPFAFVHGVYPARYFRPQGPPAGTALRRLNYHVNFRLSTQADDILHSRPIPVIEGTAGDFNFEKRRPGVWQSIPAIADAGGGLVTDPRANYVTCDLGYLGTDWEDLQAYIDHALEMLGVPAVAVRMEQTGTRSGVALVAEQVPLAQWAESRTRPFSFYERALARLCLKAGAVLGEGANLEKAAATALTLRWPEMFVELPGPERDAHDQWMLDNGLMSRKQWLQLREHLTPEEAETRLMDAAEERKAEAEMFTPPQLQQANQQQQQQQDPEGQQQPQDDPPDTDEQTA